MVPRAIAAGPSRSGAGGFHLRFAPDRGAQVPQVQVTEDVLPIDVHDANRVILRLVGQDPVEGAVVARPPKVEPGLGADELRSDAAPLSGLIESIFDAGIDVHTMHDPTRGDEAGESGRVRAVQR